MLPDPVAKADGDTVLGGQREQQLRVDGLDVAGVPAKQRHGPLRGPRSDLLDGRPVLLDDRAASVALDQAVDRVDLDRMRQVVGEVDHHAQACEEQEDSAADGEPRVVLCPGAGCQADGEQASRAVDKGRHEHAQYHLGPAISKEVAQQPRGELGRGELERDHSQTEDESDDRHNCAADRNEQCTGIVGGALKGQPIQYRTRGTVTWDIEKPTASAASAAALGSTHNAPLTYSFRAYQATDRRTRRTKPSELEVDFMNQAIAGELGRSCTGFGSFANATAGQLPASSQCKIDDMVNIQPTPMHGAVLNNSLY